MSEERTSTDVPHLALPLGGIGTGNVAICSDGSLRQWQLHNVGNHGGALPGSFFAIRATRIEPPLDVVRILQADAIPESTQTPLVTDDVAPRWLGELLAGHPGVSATAMTDTYPFARLRYLDDALPVAVSLEAFTPLVPLDAETSSLPVAMLTFRLENTDAFPVHGVLGTTLQNAVGWDGVSPIEGVEGAGYGGNTNRVARRHGWTTVVLENHALAEDAPGRGQLVLAVDDATAPVLAQWRRPEEFLTFLRSRGLADGASRLEGSPTTADPQHDAPRAAEGPSRPGSTWNAGLGVRFDLEPGETHEVRVAICWSFPNRFVDFEQFGPPRPEWGSSRFWLGNRYAVVHGDAQDVQRRVARDWYALREMSLAWPATLEASSLDGQATRHLAAQVSLVRSPTCFQSADGRFLGFEGVRGASTVMWAGDVGGSCPLNCTHVWNYEQALARTFPELERSMRETELEIMQAPEGYVPHRLIAPVYLRQLWGEPIGGPMQPALDGMLGTVLKTYREVRCGAGLGWLERFWPRIVRLLDHVESGWATDGSGMLTGVQPSTHDIDLSGLNTFMGTLWLAALRAAEEMARLIGDDPRAGRYGELFERASAAYDEALWNGDYYAQRLLPGDRPDFQWVDGCLSDQLIGQWWAHQLDLGHLLPADHVRTALQAIVEHNFRTDFHDFRHPYRVYADGDDAGLVLCSWPRGGRPEVPTRYADEVWTGVEYQVAAHCIWEGLRDEGLRVARAVWDRYDGRRRNPYNEIECGDHYARAMAGWSVLEALAGFRHDACRSAFELRLPGAEPASLPFLASEGFGLLEADTDALRLVCTGGRLAVGELTVRDLPWPAVGDVVVIGAGAERAERQDAIDVTDGVLRCVFSSPAVIEAGAALEVRSAHLGLAGSASATEDGARAG